MSEPVTLVELFGGGETSPVADPHAVYRRLRHESPVLRVRGTGYEGWLVTRHADVLSALVQDGVYSNRAIADGIGMLLGRTIVQMDGKEHTRYRSLIMPFLLPRAIRGDFMNVVEGVANDLVDRFAGAGRADLVQAFTFTYPLTVFTKVLGIPADEVDQVHRWAIALIRVRQDPVRGVEASQKLAEYLLPMIAARRAEPRPDLLSHLATAELEGHRLEDEEIVSFCRLLVIGGAETTYHLLGSAFYALLTRPGALDAVRADPAAKIQPAIDEALRWESPVQIVWRETTTPVVIAGVEVPAGARIIASLGSANRDESVFADPDAYDLGRDHAAMLAFGQGRHYCAGSRLAYAEATVALQTLLARLPGLRLAPEHEGGVVGLAFRGPERLLVAFDAAG